MTREYAADRFVEVARGTGSPDVSIALTVFDQQHYVGDAIRSLLDQREIVAEILISDDASNDRSLDRISSTLKDWSGNHRVLVRAGSRRLRRDHLALVIEQATCDPVVVAHSDDLSEPDRAATIVRAFEDTGAVLTGSSFTTIGPVGGTGAPAFSLMDRSSTGATAIRSYRSDELVGFRREFTGAVVAMRREPLRAFARLDSSHAACGHDTVLPFRASLAGPVIAIDRPLVTRRMHDNNWSKSIWDRRGPDESAFGSALCSLSALRAMLADLNRARELDLIDASTEAHLEKAIHACKDEMSERELDAYDALTSAGRVPLWVTEHEANLAWQGELLRALERKAAVREALQSVRRATRRLTSRRDLKGQRNH